jgi:hypothetical protein
MTQHGRLFHAGTACRLARYNDLRCEPGRFPMTFASKLPVIVAYIAFAFVGAIVLGVF